MNARVDALDRMVERTFTDEQRGRLKLANGARWEDLSPVEQTAVARPTPVYDDPGELLFAVCMFIDQYLVLASPRLRDAVALWIAHTHFIGKVDFTPRLHFAAAELECGKTRGLEIVGELVPSALPVVNISEAALFRLLAAEQVTLLHDEADALFGPKARDREDMRAMLNAGVQPGATIPRCVGDGAKMNVKRFPVHGAVALAGIGGLPPTLASRTITIPMQRRAPEEVISRWRRRTVGAEAGPIRDELALWASTVVDMPDVEPIEALGDRQWDCWEPLVQIATLAGGDWPARAAAAAKYVAKASTTSDVSRSVQLLGDLRAIFADRAAIFTVDVLEALNGREESAWGAWNRGDGMRPHDLAKLLKPHGIGPKQVRLVGEATTKKGYVAQEFADAWRRYLPPSEEGNTGNTGNAPASDVPPVSPVSPHGDHDRALEDPE
jgi:hypothetical protein